VAWFIFRTLRRSKERLPINWVNTELDSTSTKSTHSETPCQLSQRRRQQYLQRFHYSTLTQLTWSLTPCWLRQCGVSLGIDSVDGEWDSTSTESPPNIKKLNKSANSVIKSKTLKNLIIRPNFLCLISAKNQNKKNLIQVYLQVFSFLHHYTIAIHFSTPLILCTLAV
jgi:hypothetical protein